MASERKLSRCRSQLDDLSRSSLDGESLRLAAIAYLRRPSDSTAGAGRWPTRKRLSPAAVWPSTTTGRPFRARFSSSTRPMSSPRSTWSPGARTLPQVSRSRRTVTLPAQPAGTRSCGPRASATSRSSPAGTPRAAGAGSSCTATAATVPSTSRSSGCSSRSRPPSGPRYAATRCSRATSSCETLGHRGRSSSTETFVPSAGRPRPERGSTRSPRPSCSRPGECSRPSSTRRRCSLGRRKPLVPRAHSSRRRMGVGWRSRRRRSRASGTARWRSACAPQRQARRSIVLCRVYALSERERDVVSLLVGGLDTRAIAARLFISAHTVQDHLKAVFAKMNIHSRRELLARLAAFD
jgi:DNA-binding CsgD family transcriptional regulator